MSEQNGEVVAHGAEKPVEKENLDAKIILAEYERLRATPDKEDDRDLGDMIREESDQLGLTYLGTLAQVMRGKELSLAQKGDMALEYTWSSVLDKAFGLLETKLHLPLRGWAKQGKELMSWVTKKGKEIETKFLN